jgi:hypothetical protein
MQPFRKNSATVVLLLLFMALFGGAARQESVTIDEVRTSVPASAI